MICGRSHRKRGESLTAFDFGDAEIHTQIEVGLELALRDSDFEGAPAGHRRNVVGARRFDLAPSRALVGDQPARHGDLERGHRGARSVAGG